ncbi:DUF6233 domain-containing protein [Streptomyces sp. B21-083]|uniref:DUF6233 domain-containing protein n=1 Tax=Streptomyces sp. B21-083 TaxID=3039410 RepID=UPI003FA75E8B
MAAPRRQQDRCPSEAGSRQERARRDRPKGPDWFAEPGADRGQPVAVHTGDCYLTDRRRRPIDRADALRLLDSGLPACRVCRPDNDLAFLG